MSEQKKYEFKYLGDVEYIDINTLLTSQFHFIAVMREIQNEMYPEKKLSIKVEAFKSGCFGVNYLFETGVIDGLFNKENIQTISNIFGILSGITAVALFLKGGKAEKVKEDGNDVTIILKGKNIKVSKDAFKIYQNNKTIDVAIKKNFELLDNDENVTGIQINEDKKEVPILKIEKEDFVDLSNPNPYFDKTTNEETFPNEIVYIKKPDHFPAKKTKWIFIHKGRTIPVNVLDSDFIAEINNGIRFGQGDGLVVDLKIYYEWDERFQTYVENNKFDITKVHSKHWRGEQKKIDYDKNED